MWIKGLVFFLASLSLSLSPSANTSVGCVCAVRVDGFCVLNSLSKRAHVCDGLQLIIQHEGKIHGRIINILLSQENAGNGTVVVNADRGKRSAFMELAFIPITV